MGFSHNRSRKEQQRRLDAEEPERKQVRNLIRRGRAPRLTMAQNAEGKLPARGTYRLKSPNGKKKGRRVWVARMHSFVRYTAGVIFANKAAVGAAKRN